MSIHQQTGKLLWISDLNIQTNSIASMKQDLTSNMTFLWNIIKAKSIENIPVVQSRHWWGGNELILVCEIVAYLKIVRKMSRDSKTLTECEQQTSITGKLIFFYFMLLTITILRLFGIHFLRQAGGFQNCSFPVVILVIILARWWEMFERVFRIFKNL